MNTPNEGQLSAEQPGRTDSVNSPLLPPPSTDEIIADILERDDDPPMKSKLSYRQWLRALTESELAEYYSLVTAEHPKGGAS